MIQAQNVWIRTLYDRHRFVMRGNLGWIETGDFDAYRRTCASSPGRPQYSRLKYKSIARVTNGKLTGASKLATGSLEYQYNVTGKWWGAVFVDGGEAVTISAERLENRRGRRRTLAVAGGPIKLDFAVPVGDKDEHGLQFLSDWGLNYEFMEEDKPRGADFYRATARYGGVSGRHHDGPTSAV